jgi:aconitate hydratase
MGRGVARKLIDAHLASGQTRAGEEIGLTIDQTLTQDATGTMVMLELEAMGLDRVKPERSVQYVDHNVVQEDYKNADDHVFLHSACQRFGVWHSPAGNGVSHPIHQERFGRPGATMLGSDSHTPAAGAIGMLAIGAGGLEVALAMAGEPYYMKMPRIWGVELTGEPPDWVSAKDVILELLRRHDVDGGRGWILEYFGPGLNHLSTMDRHVLANMGTELGATTTVFPSDEEVATFLRGQQREDAWRELKADADPGYDAVEQVDLSQLEPLIAMPSSPGNVRPVRHVAGEQIYQSYIGSSANPGFRDFAIAAQIVKGKRIDPQVSLDVNPTSRQILENLVGEGHLIELIHAGARIHQAGCNGCIGMGQAPATDQISLRTVPRNFPGRSGTIEDKVCLVSPETAAASALTGRITDPRELETRYGMAYPRVREPAYPTLNAEMLVAPPDEATSRAVKLKKGPNIATLPDFDRLADDLELVTILKVGDDISTDEIMPAGARVLPYRSNIPKISEFCFEPVDATYSARAAEVVDEGGEGHLIVGGDNYGQGSSREHAALAPRYLGLRVVLAISFARIHWQNLVNFGVVPLTFQNPEAIGQITQGDVVRLQGLTEQLKSGRDVAVENTTRGETIAARHDLSARQVAMIIAGGLIRMQKQRLTGEAEGASQAV